MRKNKSLYLTVWEKQMIANIIELHLENVKTNPYFKFIEGEFKLIVKKLKLEDFEEKLKTK
jgi:hypothetical protein